MSYLYAHDNPFKSRDDMLAFADYITGTIHYARNNFRYWNDKARSEASPLKHSLLLDQAYIYLHEANAFRHLWRTFLNSLDKHAKYDIFQHLAEKRSLSNHVAKLVAAGVCPF